MSSINPFQGGSFVGNGVNKLLEVKLYKGKTLLLILVSAFSLPVSLHCVTASRKLLWTIHVPNLKLFGKSCLSCLAKAIGAIIHLTIDLFFTLPYIY